MNNIIVIGSSGRIGSAMALHFNKHRNVTTLNRKQLDFKNETDVDPILDKLEFDTVINCSAYTDVDQCEHNQDLAFTVNSQTPARVAAACARRGAKFVHFSTDYVFGGERTNHAPYEETDIAEPMSVYGQSKLEGERKISEADPNSLILRTSWVFGVERPAFPEWVISKALTSNSALSIIGDKWASPTCADETPVMIEHLLRDPSNALGTFHMVNSSDCSWADYARFVLNRAQHYGIPIKTSEVNDIPLESLTHFEAKRPIYSSLSTKKFQSKTGIIPNDWRQAVDSHVEMIAPRYLS